MVTVAESTETHTSAAVESRADTRDITSYLRGLAILAVATLHYVRVYLTPEVAGTAYLVVSVFFVISGYGIFHSLENRVGRAGMTGSTLLRFYASRAVRIFPLFWISLLLDSLLSGKLYSPDVFFGTPASFAPSIYWFVSYIIQCYVAAPFIYLALKRLGWRRYIGLVLGLLVVTYVVTITNLAHLPPTAYQGLYLGHLFLFGLGMAIPMMLSDRESLLGQKFTILLPVVAFLIFYCLSVPSITPSPTLSKYIAPLFLLSAFALCLSAIWGNVKLPLMRIIALVGTYSYSVYLFHIVFYTALAHAGVIVVLSRKSVVYTAFLFPVFLLACILAEKYTEMAFDYLAKRLTAVFDRQSRLRRAI